MSSLAALLTVHNRKDKTLACLEALFTQSLPEGVGIDVFLVDDGSVDGTAEAVSERFPWVRLMRGNGNLYWNKGMHLAFGEALKEGFDYYLWLNDDTCLYPYAIQKLLETSAQLGTKAIVVGSVQDPRTGVHTYGGVTHCSRWHPLKYRLVPPGEAAKLADTMNGNCVLIPREVSKSVGNLDQAFSHSIGDYDYGLRAKRSGFTVWVAPGYVGTCARNNPRDTWLDPNLPLHERWRKIQGPKGLPLKEWRLFARRHAGAFWPIYCLLPYIRIVLDSVCRQGIRDGWRKIFTSRQ